MSFRACREIYLLTYQARNQRRFLKTGRKSPFLPISPYMDDKSPIILLEDSEISAARQNGDMEIIELRQKTFGKPLYLHIGVRDCQATLADIVPMARALSSKLTNIVLEKVDADGAVVPCRKGCGVCCKYLIYLSIPEAFRMVEEVMMMPLEQRQDMIKSCRQLAQRFREKLNEPVNDSAANESQDAKILKCYSLVKQVCPFLRNDSCTIYEQRPIICREHIVVGSALQCRGDGGYEGAMDANVKMPVSIAKVLGQLTIELEYGNREAVVLPCVFDWYQGDVERSKRTWPASIMVKRFTDIFLRLWK